MSTQEIVFQKPVKSPVYNVSKNGLLEATLKASQGASKEVLARNIYDTFKSRGCLPTFSKFEDYKAGLLSVIKDRDNDGYYDVSMEDLNKALDAKFVSSPDSNPEKTLQSSPLFETYFKDSVSLSSSAQKPKHPLATMSYKEGLAYIKKTYKKGPWNEAKLEQFKKDVQLFMDAHFVETPVSTLQEAKDAVNDKLPKMSDDLMAQMSKDGQGRVRIDCGGYAQVYSDIFRAAGMKVKFANLVINMSDKDIRLGNHVIALGIKGKNIVYGNSVEGSKNYQVFSIAGNDEKSIRDHITGTSKGMGSIYSITYGNTQAEALKSANSKKMGAIRYFNSANSSIAGNLKLIGRLSFTPVDKLVDKTAEKFLGSNPKDIRKMVDNARQNMLSVVNSAMDDLKVLEDKADNATNISFMGVTLKGKAGVKEYAKHSKVVLSICKRGLGGNEGGVAFSAKDIEELAAAQVYFSKFNTSEGNFTLFALASYALKQQGTV